MEGGDDGHIRTGTVWTATAHAITSVIGSGVLALPWSMAQLGWIIGPITLFFFAYVTYYTATLLGDCYRTPDPVNGKRNHTYIEAVRACLGARDQFICGVMQYVSLWGTVVGYTITAAISMAQFKRSTCLHQKGHNAECNVSGTLLLIIFGAIQILLSQFPNMENLTLLSIIATVMSFAYSFISSYLCIEKFASHPKFRGSLMNLEMSNDMTPSTKVWQCFQALGNIAFAYSYTSLLIEIEDTLKSPPPENKSMRRVTMYTIGTTTLFYALLGCMGYIAFGNDAPGNILTGFSEPFWLIDMANLAVIIHLITCYQVFAQPLYALHEKWLAKKWPTGFFNHVYEFSFPFSKRRNFQFTLSKLLLRPVFILFTTLVAIVFPFFNAIVGLLGAVLFWPMTLYFPVSMYIAQANVPKNSVKWKALQSLSMVCLVVSLVSAIGSIADIIERLKHAKLFKVEL